MVCGNGLKFPDWASAVSHSSTPLSLFSNQKQLKSLTSTLNSFRIKIHHILILCAVLVLFACKKDKTDIAPFISATINGIDYSFTKDVRAAKGVTLTTALVAIGGDAQNTIAFFLSDSTAGNYSELNTPAQGKVLQSFQFIAPQDLNFNIQDNADPCNLTITTINSKYVEGYFKGTVVGSSRKKITNGKFKIYFDK